MGKLDWEGIILFFMSLIPLGAYWLYAVLVEPMRFEECMKKRERVFLCQHVMLYKNGKIIKE